MPSTAPLKKWFSLCDDSETASRYGLPRIPDFHGHIAEHAEHADLEQTDEHYEVGWRNRHEKRSKQLHDWKATETFAASESLGPLGRPATPDPSSRALGKTGWDTVCPIWRRNHRNRAANAGVFPIPPDEKEVNKTRQTIRPM